MPNDNAKTQLTDILKDLIDKTQQTEKGNTFWPTLTEDELNTYAHEVSKKIPEIIQTTGQLLVVQGIHLQERSQDLIYYHYQKARKLRKYLPDIRAVKKAMYLVMNQLNPDASQTSYTEKTMAIEQGYRSHRDRYIRQLIKKPSVSEGRDFLQQQLDIQTADLDHFIRRSNDMLFPLSETDIFDKNHYLKIFEALVKKTVQVRALAELEWNYRYLTRQIDINTEIVRPKTLDDSVYQHKEYKNAYDATLSEYKNQRNINEVLKRATENYARPTATSEPGDRSYYAKVRALTDLRNGYRMARNELSVPEPQAMEKPPADLKRKLDAVEAIRTPETDNPLSRDSRSDDDFINRQKWLGVLSSSNMRWSTFFEPNEYKKRALKQVQLEKTRQQARNTYLAYWKKLALRLTNLTKDNEADGEQLSELLKAKNNQLISELLKAENNQLNTEYNALKQQALEQENTKADNITQLAETLIKDPEKKRLHIQNSYNNWLKDIRVGDAGDKDIQVMVNGYDTIVNEIFQYPTYMSITDAKEQEKRNSTLAELKKTEKKYKNDLDHIWEKQSPSYQRAIERFPTEMHNKAQQTVSNERLQVEQQTKEALRKNRAQAMALQEIVDRYQKAANTDTEVDLAPPLLKTQTNMLISHMPTEGYAGLEYIRFYMTLMDDNQLANEKKLVLSEGKKKIIITPRGGKEGSGIFFSLGNLMRSLSWHDRYRLMKPGTRTDAPIRSVLVKKSAVFDFFADCLQSEDPSFLHHSATDSALQKAMSVDITFENQIGVNSTDDYLQTWLNDNVHRAPDGTINSFETIAPASWKEIYQPDLHGKFRDIQQVKSEILGLNSAFGTEVHGRKESLFVLPAPHGEGHYVSYTATGIKIPDSGNPGSITVEESQHIQDGIVEFSDYFDRISTASPGEGTEAAGDVLSEKWQGTVKHLLEVNHLTPFHLFRQDHDAIKAHRDWEKSTAQHHLATVRTVPLIRKLIREFATVLLKEQDERSLWRRFEMLQRTYQNAQKARSKMGTDSQAVASLQNEVDVARAKLTAYIQTDMANSGFAVPEGKDANNLIKAVQQEAKSKFGKKGAGSPSILEAAMENFYNEADLRTWLIEKQEGSQIPLDTEKAVALFREIMQETGIPDNSLYRQRQKLFFHSLRPVAQHYARTHSANASWSYDFGQGPDKEFGLHRETHPDTFALLNSTGDKQNSNYWYRPDNSAVSEHHQMMGIPFLGGLSGTTKTITTHLESLFGRSLTAEEYWTFQLYNAALMVENNYHSFYEVLFIAAAYEPAYLYPSGTADSEKLGYSILQDLSAQYQELKNAHPPAESLYQKTLTLIRDYATAHQWNGNGIWKPETYPLPYYRDKPGTRPNTGASGKLKNSSVETGALPSGNNENPVQEEGGTRYDRQLILQWEDHSTVSTAAASLAGKHPDRSTLVRLDAQGQYRVLQQGADGQWMALSAAESATQLQEAFSGVQGRVRWQLVDHEDDVKKMGAEKLSSMLRNLTDQEALPLPDRMVLVSCQTDENPDSAANQQTAMAQQLLTAFQGKEGLTLGMYTARVAVTVDGRKVMESRSQRVDYALNAQNQAEIIHTLTKEAATGKPQWLSSSLSEKALALQQILDDVAQDRQSLFGLNAGERDLLTEFYGDENGYRKTLQEVAFNSRKGVDFLAEADELASAPEDSRYQAAPDAKSALKQVRETRHRAKQMRTEIKRMMLTASPELARLDQAAMAELTDRIQQLDSAVRELKVQGVEIQFAEVNRITASAAKVVGPAGKLVFGIGAVAALCRITQINKQLAKGDLNQEQANELKRQKSQAIAELGVDIGDEVGDIVALSGPKFEQTIKKLQEIWKARGTPVTLKIPTIQSVGRMMTMGLRVAGNLAGPILAGVGAYFAWQAVAETQEALGKPGLSAERKQELQVDLALGVTSAILSTGLTLTAAVGVVAAGLSALGIQAAALTAVAAAAGPAGLLIGAALIGIFVAQWVLAGVRAVNEVEKYTELSDWERFQVGLGAMFGTMPAEVQIRYEYKKLVQQLHEQKMAEIDAVGLHYRLTDYYGAVKTMEVIPGKVIQTQRKKPWYSKPSPLSFATFGPIIDLISAIPLIPVRSATPATERQHFGKIDLTTGEFNSNHPDNAAWTPAERELRMHHRYNGRYLVAAGPERLAWIKSLKSCNPVYMTFHNSQFSSTRNAGINLHHIGSDGGRIGHDDRDAHEASPGATLYDGDINGDGIKDTLLIDSFGNITATLNGAPGKSKCRTEGTLLLQLFDFNQQTTVKAHLFLHDINHDGKDDLVVHKSGKVHVALSQGDGSFSTVSHFVILGTVGQEENIFPDADVLGFMPGTNTLLSWKPGAENEGDLYASLVVPAAANIRSSYIDFSRKLPAQRGTDNFTASGKEPEKEGEYIFEVYDTQSQTFTGGKGSDRFEFNLSKNIHKGFGNEIRLNGSEGYDQVIFRQEKDAQRGIRAELRNSTDPALAIRLDLSGTSRMLLHEIESITGTPYRDILINLMTEGGTLNGNGGTDRLKGGNGGDTLIIEHGVAEGGSGIDSYVMLKSEVKGELRIIESKTGEQSQIQLAGSLSLIRGIYWHLGDLHLDLENHNGTIRTLMLNDFYRDRADDEAPSVWDFRTTDGFNFRLESGQSMSSLIRVGYTLEEDSTIEVPAAVEKIQQTVKSIDEAGSIIIFKKDGSQETRTLPTLFSLQPSGGADRPDILTGSPQGGDLLNAFAGSGAIMTGENGQNLYLIHPSDRPGSVTVNGSNDGDSGEEDRLILPWRFDDITWSASGANLIAHHTHRSAQNNESVDQQVILNTVAHLAVEDVDGEIRYLSNGDVSFLSYGPLNLYDSDQLELTFASGRVELDARFRRLTAEDPLSTVITDDSQADNIIYGTPQARNLIRAMGGRNMLFGGSLDDELYGGTGDDAFFCGAGNDVITGGAGNDTLYGDEGNDRYIFMAGDGHDIVSDSDGDQDVLVLQGIHKAQLHFSHESSEDVLVVSTGLESDRVEMYYQFGRARPHYAIERIEAGSDTLRLAEAIASFESTEKGTAANLQEYLLQDRWWQSTILPPAPVLPG